jgi:hypothetical protein
MLLLCVDFLFYETAVWKTGNPLGVCVMQIPYTRQSIMSVDIKSKSAKVQG